MIFTEYTPLLGGAEGFTYCSPASHPHTSHLERRYNSLLESLQAGCSKDRKTGFDPFSLAYELAVFVVTW